MTSSPDAQERLAAVKHLREMMHDIPVAMLTTVARDGSLNSRPMVNVNDTFDGDLWFFTAYDDPKVAEIAANSAVNVSFAAPAKGRYVSAAGTAELVRDAKRIELHWTDACEPWFPNGPQDPNLGLLKVNVESAAYWDQQRGAMIAVAGFFKRLVTGDKSGNVRSEQVNWPV